MLVSGNKPLKVIGFIVPSETWDNSLPYPRVVDLLIVNESSTRS